MTLPNISKTNIFTSGKGCKKTCVYEVYTFLIKNRHVKFLDIVLTFDYYATEEPPVQTGGSKGSDIMICIILLIKLTI